MRIIPEKAYLFLMNRVVGKILVYSYKREFDAGRNHEALHVAAALKSGNSEDCNGQCTLLEPVDWSKLHVARLPFEEEFQDDAERSSAIHDSLVHIAGELRVDEDSHWKFLNQLRARGFTVMKKEK